MSEYFYLFFFSLIVIVGFFFMYAISRKRKTISIFDQRLFITEWQKIQKKRYSSPYEAIIEADKLLDKLLDKLGYQGSMGDKLKRYPHLFRNLEGVWGAHKLRNKIAHEINFQMEETQILLALREYKHALNDLGLKL